jgi:predicted transposase/invertase (TIGR01784 family)
MIDISRPHDSFFRFLISKTERAIELVRFSIPPELAQYLKFKTMRPVPGTFVDSRLRHRYSDALFVLQTIYDAQSFIYALIDHKSNPTNDVILQLQRYFIRIWEGHLLNHPGTSFPPIIGIVFYHGKSPWNIGTDFKSYFDCKEEFHPYLPLFRYILVDLSNMDENQFQGTPEMKAALMLMKYSQYPNLHEIIAKIFEVLKEARHIEDFLSLLEACILYLMCNIKEEYHEEIAKVISIEFPEGEKIMPTVADKLIRQGREEGREEGLEEGIEIGLAKGIIKVLQAKFSNFPQTMEAKILAVRELSTLEAIMDIAIQAESLDQFEQQLESYLTH